VNSFRYGLNFELLTNCFRGDGINGYSGGGSMQNGGGEDGGSGDGGDDRGLGQGLSLSEIEMSPLILRPGKGGNAGCWAGGGGGGVVIDGVSSPESWTGYEFDGEGFGGGGGCTSESGVWSNGKDGVVVIVADELWEEWGTWSVCSVSCRGQGQIGTRQRFRTCNSFNEDDRSNCVGEHTETVQCSGDSFCTDGNLP
jgi:hypothetical protein